MAPACTSAAISVRTSVGEASTLAWVLAPSSRAWSRAMIVSTRCGGIPRSTGELHAVGAEQVDEGVDAVRCCGCQSLAECVAVVDGSGAVGGEPGVVGW